MPCKQCEERRKMIAKATAKDGVKGAVKVAPAVAKHMWTDVRDRLGKRT